MKVAVVGVGKVGQQVVTDMAHCLSTVDLRLFRSQDSLDPIKNSEIEVVLDCTADPHLGSHYLEWLGAGKTVITANKFPIARHFSQFKRFITAVPQSLFFNATVLTHIPLFTVLKSRQMRHNPAIKIDAHVSSSLGAITLAIRQGQSLKSAMELAQKAGLTEPDPSRDLSGNDVRIKAEILSQMMGIQTPVLYFEPFFKIGDDPALLEARLRQDQYINYGIQIRLPDQVSVGWHDSQFDLSAYGFYIQFQDRTAVSMSAPRGGVAHAARAMLYDLNLVLQG